MSIAKNPVQIEFCNLMTEMERKGVKPAAVARMLGKSRASVSQWLAGNSTPKEGTMILFRKLVAEASQVAGDVKYELAEGDHLTLHDQLSDLERHDPEAFESARQMIGLLHSRSRQEIEALVKAAEQAQPSSWPKGQRGGYISPDVGRSRKDAKPRTEECPE